MFSAEIYFHENASDLEAIGAATDDIFSKYQLPCIRREKAVRIYGDNGDPKDFGKLYAAIGRVKRTPSILRAIKDGYFDSGYDRETLMTSFFKH